MWKARFSLTPKEMELAEKIAVALHKVDSSFDLTITGKRHPSLMIAQEDQLKVFRVAIWLKKRLKANGIEKYFRMYET